jgi:hypothetical protein
MGGLDDTSATGRAIAATANSLVHAHAGTLGPQRVPLSRVSGSGQASTWHGDCAGHAGPAASPAISRSGSGQTSTWHGDCAGHAGPAASPAISRSGSGQASPGMVTVGGRGELRARVIAGTLSPPNHNLSIALFDVESRVSLQYREPRLRILSIERTGEVLADASVRFVHSNLQ